MSSCFAAAQTKFDACTILSGAEVQEATGSAVAGAQPNAALSRPDRTSACDIITASGTRISIVIGRNLEKEEATKEYQTAEAKKRMPNAKLRGISGLGDWAAFLEMPPLGTSLVVLQGNRFISVGVLGAGVRAPAVAEKLARTALPRF